MPQGNKPYTAQVGGTNRTNGQQTGNGVSGVRIAVGWPTERWVGLLILTLLGLLILVRFGFRGLGFQGNIGGRVTV